MAIQHNLVIRQGEDFAQAFIARRNGVVIPLTSYTIAAQIRRRIDVDDVAEEFVCTIVDAEAGHFVLSLPSARTAALPAGRKRWDRASRYEYDVKLTSPEGANYVPIEGYVQIDPSVTR